MQGKQRTPCPHSPPRHGNTRSRSLAGKRVTRVYTPVLHAAALNPRVAEQGLAQRTAAQSGHGRPRPAQRSGSDHAVRENHGLAIAVQYHFTDVCQFVSPQLQGGALITIGGDEADADRTHGKIMAALPEPARQ